MYRSLFCLFALIFIQCETEGVKKNFIKTIISGKIDYPHGSMVSIIGPDNSVTTRLKDGWFRLELDLNMPTYLRLEHYKDYASLYISPGDDLSVYFDANDFEVMLLSNFH